MSAINSLIKYFILALIIYVIASHNKEGIDLIKNIITVDPVEDKIAENKASTDHLAELEQILPKELIKEVEEKDHIPYLERKIAGILISLSKTPEGIAMIKNLVKMVPTMDKDEVKPDYSDVILDTIDIKIGAGEQVECGQTISGEYVDKKQKFSGSLGGDGLPKAVELGVFGMKVGGERKIIAMGGDVYHVKLHSATPSALPHVQTFDKAIISRFATICGQVVKCTYKIYEVDSGDMVYDHQLATGSESLEFKLDSKLPYGMLKGIVGMSLGGTRNIIITPESMKTIDKRSGRGFFPKDVKLLPYKSYLVEVDQKVLYIQ